MSFKLAERMRLDVDDTSVEVRERRWGVVVELTCSEAPSRGGKGKDTGVAISAFEEAMMMATEGEGNGDRWCTCDDVR
jgi:hypothetical protein